MQPGMGFDLQQLLAQAQQLQDDMLRAQQDLAEALVTGTAGGGLVTATLSGAGELVALQIKPASVDPADTETLAELIIAAVRDARREGDELTQDTMGSMTDGLGSLPGGFGSLSEGIGGFPELPGRPG